MSGDPKPPDPNSPTSSTSALSYKSAGVDIEAGNEAVQRIKALVATTRRPEQLDQLGGFAGMMRIPPGYREPVLVSCTDGVGTKLLVAIAANRCDTVGIDLVAMCVNDLLVCGAEPLFLLDYIATSKLEPPKIEAIVAGIVEGCRQSQAALLGGETAELPGLYQKDHFDLAATAVGVVEHDAIWSPQRSQAEDCVYALPSTGLHSNGYSLARKALLSPEHAGLQLEELLPGTAIKVVDALLSPTKIYASAFAALRKLESSHPGIIHGAANITGGGLIENPPRALRDELGVRLDLSLLEMPAIMRVIQQQGVDPEEMLRTFNCGVGMLVYVDPGAQAPFEAALSAAGQDFIQIGQVIERQGGPAVQVDATQLKA